jgi:hypothetical protein
MLCLACRLDVERCQAIDPSSSEGCAARLVIVGFGGGELGREMPDGLDARCGVELCPLSHPFRWIS